MAVAVDVDKEPTAVLTGRYRARGIEKRVVLVPGLFRQSVSLCAFTDVSIHVDLRPLQPAHHERRFAARARAEGVRQRQRQVGGRNVGDGRARCPVRQFRGLE
jgi:hypothetical protein